MNDLAKQTQITAPLDVSEKSIFSNVEKFQQVKFMAEYLAESDMVPEDYQKKPANVLIALSMAERMKADPMMVMQNLYVIHGRPSWSSQFLIAGVNNSGMFSPLKFEEAEGQETEVEYTYFVDRKPRTSKETVKNDTCRAYATELKTGEVIYGPIVSVEMAVKEGWYSKPGSKWKTMPQLMLNYRSAAFFIRTKCPEVSMGMYAEDEVRDMGNAVVVENDSDISSGNAQKILDGIKDKKTEEKKAPAKEKASKSSPITSPVDDEIEEEVDGIDMGAFLKQSIDSCTTLEDLLQCGEDIKVRIDGGELTEFEIRDVKKHLDSALKTMKNPG